MEKAALQALLPPALVVKKQVVTVAEARGLALGYIS